MPQSPQLFKQLLMIAGIERYFQIARCYRDEDFRADRQPEFTQLDIEMSFVDQDDVIDVGEAVVRALWSGVAGHDIPPIQRIAYADAMRRYGTDKPDLRFAVELVELTDYFADTPFRVFQAPYVGAVVMPGGASQLRRAFDAWQEWAKQRGARGLAYVVFNETGELSGPVAKNLSEPERQGLAAATGAEPGDCVFFAAGVASQARQLLGAARDEIGGGSIRIHRGDGQQQVFEILGLSQEQAEQKFGFLLEAFKYGPPPHGGIAFGWDRICMLLAGAASLRDVIAFPKTGGGYDPLTSAPEPITAEQRAEAGVDAVPEAEADELG